MTVIPQTPREIVEAFLKGMEDIDNEYSDRINTAKIQCKAANRAWSGKQTDTNGERKNACNAQFSTLLKEYRLAQVDVLKILNMKVPSDFFDYLPTGNVFRDKVVVSEKIINSKKIKIFTEIRSTPNTEQFFTVFTLEKMDDNWIIVKIREYNGNTQKESSILW